MANIRVKYISKKDEIEKPLDGSNSWVSYWEKYSEFKLQDFCRDCGEKITNDNPFEGAQIQMVDYADKETYIVPVCKKCHLKGMVDEHIFYCEEDVLVYAKKKKHYH